MVHPARDPRLRFILQRTPEEVFEPDAVSEAPLVRFVAYAREHRLFGWVHLRAERLTDLINAHRELELSDVEIESLEDGRRRVADRVVIDVGELVAVHASGPRGNPSLRHRTRTHPLAIQSGSYLIGGHLHAEPGIDPIQSFRERPVMVPLTDAWIEYWSGAARTRRGTGTIIVNRQAADVVRSVTDDELIDGLLQLDLAGPDAAPDQPYAGV
jgi:hypothetical protein